MEGAQAGPVREEGVCLPPDGGRSVGELQQREVRLLHLLQDGHILPLRTQHPAPEQVQLTAGQKKKDGGKGKKCKKTDECICKNKKKEKTLEKKEKE